MNTWHGIRVCVCVCKCWPLHGFKMFYHELLLYYPSFLFFMYSRWLLTVLMYFPNSSLKNQIVIETHCHWLCVCVCSVKNVCTPGTPVSRAFSCICLDCTKLCFNFSLLAYYCYYLPYIYFKEEHWNLINYTTKMMSCSNIVSLSLSA